MSGSKINDYSIGDSNIQSVMLTLDKAYKGLHQVSLTNYDNTSASQIAAGSVVENNGALYQFTSNESITGSPSNGTVYIRLVPSGDTITAEYTNTKPTWSDSKQGWYGTSTDANKRYLEFYLIKQSSVWQKFKRSFYEYDFIKTPNLVTLKIQHTVAYNPTGTLLNFESVQDTLGQWNNSTRRFTASRDGYYSIMGNIQLYSENTFVEGTSGVRLRKNGSQLTIFQHTAGEHRTDQLLGRGYYISMSYHDYLVKGDYIDIYSYSLSPNNYTYFTGSSGEKHPTLIIRGEL